MHCPLTPDTQDLIDAKAFKPNEKSAFLINCARGGIVIWNVLADALRAGAIVVPNRDVDCRASESGQCIARQ